MPLYDYACKECGHEFTEVVAISKRHQPEGGCKECGSPKLSLLIGTPMVVSGVSRRHSEGFNDRLKEMKKKAGKGHTLDKAIQ